MRGFLRLFYGSIFIVLPELAICEYPTGEVGQEVESVKCDEVSPARLNEIISGANKLTLGHSREEVIAVMGSPTREEDEVAKIDGRILGRSLMYYVRDCGRDGKNSFLLLILDVQNKLRVVDPNRIDGIKPKMEYRKDS